VTNFDDLLKSKQLKANSKSRRGVYERDPGSDVWWIRYADSNGRIRREKVGKKQRAIDLYTIRKTDALHGRKFPESMRASEKKFEELANDTLEYSKTHKASYRMDKSRMAVIVKEFGQRQAASITPQDIEKWFARDFSEHSPATVNRYRALLSLVFRQGIRNRKVTANPARLVKQRPESRGRVRWLQADEETRLKAVMEAHYPHRIPELDLALNTGIRRGEQYAMTWDNVDFERRQLHIMHTKNGEDKYVPLNDTAMAALRTAKQFSTGEAPVFTNRHGEALQSSRQWFNRALTLAKITDFRWHDLRHTFASKLTMLGANLRTVQQLMGHKTLAMTVRYSHLSSAHQQDAVQLLCGSKPAVQSEPTSTTTDTGTETTVATNSTRIQ
jgi:site-specific recombinase XerD